MWAAMSSHLKPAPKHSAFRHGGGGPGMGPIGVKSHPFIRGICPGPIRTVVKALFQRGGGAPYGSPSLLPILVVDIA